MTITLHWWALPLALAVAGVVIAAWQPRDSWNGCITGTIGALFVAVALGLTLGRLWGTA